MNSGSIFALVALAGAIGWFSARDPAVDTPAPRNSPSATTVQAAGWQPGEMELARAADGHFYAEVTIDSVPLRMLVDSGASVVALTGADAAALGLEWTEDDIVPIGRGASGEVRGKIIQLSHVQLGDLSADNIAAVIVPDGLTVSLLGQSFLARVEQVEIHRDTMRLGS